VLLAMIVGTVGGPITRKGAIGSDRRLSRAAPPASDGGGAGLNNKTAYGFFRLRRGFCRGGGGRGGPGGGGKTKAEGRVGEAEKGMEGEWTTGREGRNKTV